MVYTGQLPKQGVRSRVMADRGAILASLDCWAAEEASVRGAQAASPSPRHTIETLITVLPAPA
jgi:hypothetical protein